MDYGFKKALGDLAAENDKNIEIITKQFKRQLSELMLAYGLASDDIEDETLLAMFPPKLILRFRNMKIGDNHES